MHSKLRVPALIAGAFFVCAPVAEAAVLQVPPPSGAEDDLPTIQGVVDAAADGDTLHFPAGTYVLSGVDSGEDVDLCTPGGCFSYQDSVRSWFGSDPDGAISQGAMIDTRGKRLVFEGTVDAAGDPATVFTEVGPPDSNGFLVHSERVWMKDLAFVDMVGAILGFAPINLDNVDFENVFYPVSAYVDSRFAHPNWDPHTRPNDYTDTIRVTWTDVRYIHCGQSHVSMSAWTIEDSYLQTEQYAPWGDDWFYASIFTGPFGYLFSEIGPRYGGTAVPEDVLAMKVFQDFRVKNTTLIGNGTFAGIDVTYWPSLETPTRGGSIEVEQSWFADTNGIGFSVWKVTPEPVSDVKLRTSHFENVDDPWYFWAAPGLGPIKNIQVRDNDVVR